VRVSSYSWAASQEPMILRTFALSMGVGSLDYSVIIQSPGQPPMGCVPVL
jgi:hypothetical protein